MMKRCFALRFAAAAITGIALASCGGSGAQHLPAAVPAAPDQAMSTAVAQSPVTLGATRAQVAVALGGGYSAHIGLHGAADSVGRSITLQANAPALSSDGRTVQSKKPCPSISPIRVRNPFGHAITIELDDFEVHVPCSINGLLFGVSFYQVEPQPPIVRSLKLGDLTGTGNELEFQPSVHQLTLPPMTTSVIAILREMSTSEIGVPVAPGATTELTTNAPVPTTLDFSYTTGTGGSAYSVGCFPAFVSGVIDPRIAGTPRVGVPSFFCVLDPGTSTITFGGDVGFAIGLPKPDASILGLDGPAVTAVCTQGATAANCDTPSFSIGNSGTNVFKNIIVGNADALRICAPVTVDTDCNALASPAPARATVSLHGGDFQLLVADDPTYRATNNWDGLFRSVASGACRFSTTPDNNNGDVPPSPAPGKPGYSDADQTGVGPYAEYDVTPTGTGICTIKMTEDPRYISDFTNRAAPTGRTATLAITVNP